MIFCFCFGRRDVLAEEQAWGTDRREACVCGCDLEPAARDGGMTTSRYLEYFDADIGRGVDSIKRSPISLVTYLSPTVCQKKLVKISQTSAPVRSSFQHVERRATRAVSLHVQHVT